MGLAQAPHFAPDFLPRSGGLALTPKTVARLPLLGASGFSYPKNPMISNSVRLELPRLDISVWRQRAAAAGTPRVSDYLRSENQTLLWPIAEEARVSVSKAGSPISRPETNLISPPPMFRAPPVNNRHMQQRNDPANSSASSRGGGFSRLSLHGRPESVHERFSRPNNHAERFDIAPSSCDSLGAFPLFSF